jgi:hypothetical protein
VDNTKAEFIFRFIERSGFHDNTFAKMKWKKIGFCRSVGLSELPSTQKDKSRCLPFYHSYSVFIRSLP